MRVSHCSDKTGTLTQNKMTVTHLWSGGMTWRVSGTLGYEPTGVFSREKKRKLIRVKNRFSSFWCLVCFAIKRPSREKIKNMSSTGILLKRLCLCRDGSGLKQKKTFKKRFTIIERSFQLIQRVK